jgi:hypothetical protein
MVTSACGQQSLLAKGKGINTTIAMMHSMHGQTLKNRACDFRRT